MLHGNATFSQSGYGVELDLMARGFLKDGWGVAQAANFGVQGYPIMHDGLKIYQQMADPYGSDALYYHSKNFGANLAISMIDSWTLDANFLKRMMDENIRWMPYIPIDQSPVPPTVISNLNLAYKILTFSKFGQKELEKMGFASKMIYEGVDMKLLKPADQMKARDNVKLPKDKFIFGMIAANKENPPRKGFQEALEAFAMFAGKHPDAILFIHTQQISPGGFPLQAYAKQLGVLDRIFFLDQIFSTYYCTRADIAEQLNAMDVLLHPSQTEGFGMTIVEAQSCGKPAVVNNCQSMPELVIEGKTGAICDVATKWLSPSMGYWGRADVNSLYDKMEKVYKMVKDNPKQVEKDCIANVDANFNFDKILVNDWIPLLERMQDKILPKELTDSK